MRLAFMGSPGFAVPTLRALHAAGHEIVAVYCQPPRPAGRGQAVRRCPVHLAAERWGCPCTPPPGCAGIEAVQAAFAALDLDAAVVAAYGLLLPRAMLEAPRRGCLNVHASLLPRWRGAAPIQAAILAGDRESGITIMRMEEGLDTGPMLLARGGSDHRPHDRGQPARRAGAARRDPRRPRAGRESRATAAAGDGCDLRAEADAGRRADRLDAGRRRCSTDGSGRSIPGREPSRRLRARR